MLVIGSLQFWNIPRLLPIKLLLFTLYILGLSSCSSESFDRLCRLKESLVSNENERFVADLIFVDGNIFLVPAGKRVIVKVYAIDKRLNVKLKAIADLAAQKKYKTYQASAQVFGNFSECLQENSGKFYLGDFNISNVRNFDETDFEKVRSRVKTQSIS